MLPRAWIQLQVAILFMCSAGIRIGAFAFLDVEDLRPVYRKAGEVVVPEPRELKLGMNGLHVLPAGAELLCGAMTVYSEEGGDEYDTLITKEAYHKWAEYLEVRVRMVSGAEDHGGLSRSRSVRECSMMVYLPTTSSLAMTTDAGPTSYRSISFPGMAIESPHLC